MSARRLLNLVFSVCVTVGLALSPLAMPASAAQSHMTGVSGMSMSGDMPCCPDEGQKSKNCQDCPLVAICILKTAQAGPSTAEALPLRHAIRTTHAVRNDVPADGFDHPPPDHPPRNLA
jgi:hypothetical protein